MVSSSDLTGSQPDGTPQYTAHRTVVADIPAIERLIGSAEATTYPQSSLQVGRVLETSMISMTMMKGSEIVGFGSFNIPKNFDKIIADNKDLAECTSRTTLCLTVLIMNRRENIQEISKLLFTTLFQAVTMLYTVITRWPDKRLECGRIINEATNVGIIAREEFVPVLYAREGNYQDNDDVMNVYADESDQLREYYGDFFFTELVEASDNRNKVLVADVNDTAVGCLAVTADIAFDTLRRTHHIGHFDTLSPQNSIAIQLYTIKEEYESRGIDLIRGAFECFPAAEWIAISLPRQIQFFSLLNMFTRVSPKGAIADTEVFVLHRAILTNSINVRKATVDDIRELAAIDGETGVKMEDIIEEGCDDEGHAAHGITIQLGGTIIGGLVLIEEYEIKKIRTYFDIEQFIHFKEQKSHEHFRILSCSIAPGYQALTRHVLSESLRLVGGVTLYQRVIDSNYPKSAVTKELLNIKTRGVIHYPEEELGINMPSEECFGETNYGLLLFSKKHTFENRIQLGHSIVVVGASDVGVAAVQQLVQIPNLRLNNLTFVSDIFHDDYLTNPEGVQKRLTNDHIKNDVGLCVSVSRCRATMAGINVRDKKLILSNGKWLPYDIMLLCTGKQITGIYDKEPGLNGHQLADLIEELKDDEHAKIFIKGTTLEALAAIERITSNDIDHGRIIYGLDEPITSLFDIGKEDLVTHKLLKEKDIDIGGGILDYLRDEGVDVIEDCDKIEVVKHPTGQIDCVKVGNHEYECDIVLDFGGSRVSRDVFKVLSDACLVYDGALVVKPDYTTSNDFVLGAGTMTKYPRHLHGDEWTHDKYNSRDVGTDAANQILSRIQNGSPINNFSIPYHRSPIVDQCVLPGGRYYLSIKSPPRDTLNDGNKAKMARWLFTLKNQTISKIHINPFGMIDQMMFLSPKKLPIENIERLYGIHESYINQLVSRYDEDLIPCLLAHICQPAIQAVNHDRFKLLIKEFDELINLSIDDINPHTYQQLDEKYTKQTEEMLLGFLEHNRPLLSMYAEPSFKTKS